ncbi:MAG: hypothetical protein JWM99_4196 [Verrucomicrobiales bacterium]|nr:hypothetical protein [Verrucomicrobiales bacterium]
MLIIRLDHLIILKNKEDSRKFAPNLAGQNYHFSPFSKGSAGQGPSVGLLRQQNHAGKSLFCQEDGSSC